MAITADRLLEGVKRRIIVPSSQVSLTNADMLAFADDVIKARVVPLIMSLNEEYFVVSEDETLVASQSEYAIPYRAVGRTLRDLKLVDDDDNVQNLVKISLEDAQVYDSSAQTIGFYFRGDKIHLVPDVPSTLSTTLTLRKWYRMVPNNLCLLSAAAVVTSTTATTVTVSSVPSTMTAGVAIDFIQGKSGNSVYAIDKSISSVAGSTLTFAASNIPSDLVAGDYLSLAATSPVINFIPTEAYALIESLTAHRVLSSIGDYEAARAMAEDIAAEEKHLKNMLEPRIEGEPTVIINRASLVRGGKFSQRRWLYGGV